MEHKIALEIDGKRFEAEDITVIDALQNILVQAGVLDDGDILEVLERDQDYILHMY